MIILIGLIPAKFAIDKTKSPEQLYEKVVLIEESLSKVDSVNLNIEDKIICRLLIDKTKNIKSIITGVANFDEIKGTQNFQLRKDILELSKETNKLLSNSFDEPSISLTKTEISHLKKNIASIKTFTEYSPWWVILMISVSLGLGTMIGWKRIVITVGEKIGKTPLTYAQGASAELVAAATIQMASALGLPVSTTHVLSSGVAGSMVAQKGLKNLRMKTVRNILVAWLITLPVTIVLSGAIFLLLRWAMG
jgi:PiT family inorganic phosphate transporter